MSEQFENSIRKKLQDADIPFDPAAWDQMKKRLDDSDRHRPVLFWWILSGLLILAAAGGSLWWWANNQEKNNPLHEKQRVAANVSDSIIQPVPSLEPVENNIPATNTNNPADKNSPEAKSTARRNNNTSSTNLYNPSTSGGQNQSATTEGNNSATGKKVTAAVNIKTANGQISTGNSQVDANAKTVDAQTSTGATTQQGANSNTQTPVAITKIAGAQTPAATTKTEDAQIPSVPTHPPTNTQTPAANENAQIPSVVTHPATNSNTQTLAIKDSAQQLSTTTQQDSIKPKKPQRKGLEAGITLGPDYNVAASMKRGKIGFNLGVVLKYNFSNRWSIQSGAIYNKKVYGANASEYTFTYPVTYKWVAADCNVLDVPLNVYYTFSETGRTRWSAVLGASSYFMLKEKYDYWWANGNKNTHQYKNENQHYFSVVNIGVNWEHQTMGRLRWSLQPYVKVPLGGVGQGKIRLYTAGLALQLTMGKK